MEKEALQSVIGSNITKYREQAGLTQAQLAELIKYASIVVSSLPIMLLYPFVQKYFNHGVMLGSVKG